MVPDANESRLAVGVEKILVREVEPLHVDDPDEHALTVVVCAASRDAARLRCADPIPFDMEYTRDLGYSAARYIIEGGTAALISIQDGHVKPIPFASIMDAETGRMRVRMVDIESDRYKIARTYMLRLKRIDFEDAAELEKLARAANMTPQAFAVQFGGLVASDAPRPSIRVKSATPTS